MRIALGVIAALAMLFVGDARAQTAIQFGVFKNTPWNICAYDSTNTCQRFLNLPASGGGPSLTTGVTATTPTTSPCDNSNLIATTAFVTTCGSGGSGNPGGSLNAIQYKSGAGLFGGTSIINNAIVGTNGSGVPNETTVLPNGITATTQTNGDSSSMVATDSFVATAIAGITGSPGGSFNSVQFNSSGVFGGISGNNGILITGGTGVPSIGTAIPNGVTATTQTSSDNSTKLATDAFVQALIAASGVSSFNTRTGAVVATSGDYTAAQVTGALVNTNNLSDVSSASTARTNLGLGTFAVANATTPPAIGGVTPAAGAFTTLTTNGLTNILSGPFQIGGNTMTFPAVASTMGFVVGSTTSGHCVQWATGAAGGLADAGSACGSGGGGGGGSAANVQDFVAPGNFTPGTTTQLTLASLPASAAALDIYFDATHQSGDTWSLNTGTGVVTFDAAIPTGTQVVEAKWFSISISGGTVSSVTVNSANGLAGTVVNPTTTPSITLSTTVTGILQGNGTAISSIASVGTGSVVLQNSPSIASPTLTGTVAGANTIPLSILAQSGANTMLGNWTASTANVTANAIPSCADSGGNHLNYVSGTGITCGTGLGSAITALTGDVTASGPGSVSATVTHLQNIAVKTGTPTDGTVLTYVLADSEWEPIAAPSGNVPTGGTTGQALIKNSNTNFDTKWSTIAGSGTVTSITCNAGLTGGAITTSGTCALDVTYNPVWTGANTFNGGVLAKRRTITSGASDTVLATDYLIAWDKTSGSASGEALFACASGIDGQIYIIKDEKGDAATNNITITPASGTIEGASTAVMNSNNASITIQCDGSKTNWVVE